jgi:hypothetical protein
MFLGPKSCWFDHNRSNVRVAAMAVYADEDIAEAVAWLSARGIEPAAWLDHCFSLSLRKLC